MQIYLVDLVPVVFPNGNHIISKKDFKTKEVLYIIDSKREFPFTHSFEELEYCLFLKIPSNFYIKSVLIDIFNSCSLNVNLRLGSKPGSITSRGKINEILSQHAHVDLTLENLERIDFQYAIDRTPGLVGVVINLSRRETSPYYKSQLSNHFKKFLGYCRIKDVPDRLRIPRCFVLYSFLLRINL